MLRSKYVISITAILVLLITSSCGPAGVLREVTNEDKDPLFIYDGVYNALINDSGGQQELGSGWYVTCGSLNFRIRLTVNKSEVVWRVDGKVVAKSFVDRDGRFRLKRPLDSKLRITGGIATDDRRFMILQGIVHRDQMEGRLVYASAQFDGRGCTYPVEYEVV